jgi:hypothetical protein
VHRQLNNFVKNIIACIFNLCFLILCKSPDINWNDNYKKEARGSNDEDLGEVQDVTDVYVLVQRHDKQRKILHSPRSGRKLR